MSKLIQTALKNKMLKLKKIEDVLLFLTLLFLPTQLGKHFWPNFAYIYSLKIDYLSPTIYFWDILVTGLLVVWVLRKPKVNRPALNLFLLFIFTQLLSLKTTSNIGTSLVRLEQYLLAGLSGVFLASTDFKSLIKKMYLPLLLGVLGESILAILQVIKGSTLGLWVLGERTFTISTPGIAKFDFYGRQFLRPYGTFPHPNVLAGFMLLAGIILISLSVIARRESLTDVAIFRVKIVDGGGRFRTSFGMTILRVSSCLAGLTIFLTMGRTAILAGFIALVILLRRKWLMIIIIIAFILSPILFTRYSSLFNFDNLTFLRREELVGNAWEVFLKYPLFGVGLNNFIPVMAGNLLTGPSRFLQPVHNIIFLTLAETGIVGLVGFLLLLGYPLKRMYNIKCTIYNYLPWLIIIFLGLFDHYFLTLPQGYRLLFLVWGLSFSMVK